MKAEAFNKSIVSYTLSLLVLDLRDISIQLSWLGTEVVYFKIYLTSILLWCSWIFCHTQCLILISMDIPTSSIRCCTNYDFCHFLWAVGMKEQHYQNMWVSCLSSSDSRESILLNKFISYALLIFSRWSKKQ